LESVPASVSIVKPCSTVSAIGVVVVGVLDLGIGISGCNDVTAFIPINIVRNIQEQFL
jgi:hypothetical protein